MTKKIRDATTTKCSGGPNCPLGLAKHPKASRSASLGKFALGCSICRSEKIEEVKTTNLEGGFN